MARGLNKLSARAIVTLKAKGRHSDGGGLFLSIGEEGRRRWVFMYVRRGKRTELGLGGAELSLADARGMATNMRAVLAKKGDPKAWRDVVEASALTFGECADAHIQAHKSSWRNEKHVAQWEMTLREYAAPIRKKPVSTVSTQDVLDVLKPHWQRAPETAKRLQGRIEAVLDSAKANGQREGDNPARWRGHLDRLLPKRSRLSRGHHAALSHEKLPDFMTQLRARPGSGARALEFAILTAARTGEVLGARWEEVDLEKRIWIVPAARMKMGKEHRVPLSEAAVAVLQGMVPQPAGLVFPGSKKGAALSNMALLMTLRRMERGDLTAHGFRSTFKDWASETTHFPSEVSEMALAHTVGDKVEAAYRRGDLFEKRRELADAWARYCGPAPANVIEMTAARGKKDATAAA